MPIDVTTLREDLDHHKNDIRDKKEAVEEGKSALTEIDTRCVTFIASLTFLNAFRLVLYTLSWHLILTLFICPFFSCFICSFLRSFVRSSLCSFPRSLFALLFCLFGIPTISFVVLQCLVILSDVPDVAIKFACFVKVCIIIITGFKRPNRNLRLCRRTCSRSSLTAKPTR